MNGYELLDLFDSHLATVMTFFVAFISATSAFLVVAQLAAKNLPRLIANLAVGLYSLTAIFFLATFNRHWTSLLTIRDQLIEKQISWYPAVYEPQWIMPISMWIGFSIMIILAMGSIWYFVSVRKNDDHT